MQPKTNRLGFHKLGAFHNIILWIHRWKHYTQWGESNKFIINFRDKGSDYMYNIYPQYPNLYFQQHEYVEKYIQIFFFSSYQESNRFVSPSNFPNTSFYAGQSFIQLQLKFQGRKLSGGSMWISSGKSSGSSNSRSSNISARDNIYL